MLVLVGPGVSANAIAINAIAINKDVGVHMKMPLNVRNRVVSPTGIAERTASLEIRLKLQLASALVHNSRSRSTIVLYSRIRGSP